MRSSRNGIVPDAVSARVPLGDYGTALFITAFLAIFLLYIEAFMVGAVLALVVLPAIAALRSADRIAFDGKRLRRTGLLFRVWAYLWRYRTAVRLRDIEFVSTSAERSFRRGGRILFRYRTHFHGRGAVFAVSSSAKGYAGLMKAVLPLLDEGILDQQTIDIRDYFREPSEVLADAVKAGIPSADVLEGSLRRYRKAASRSNETEPDANSSHSSEKAESLIVLANELKVSGRLVQSLEAFRRAVRLKPPDAKTLFDLSRCLRTFAGTQRDGLLERKSSALLRLAERRAGDDPALLTSLAEFYFAIGEWQRSARVFQKSIDNYGGSVRALIGLAELALRDGKLAYVVHHFAAANGLARSKHDRRRTREEINYFSRLNEDHEYLDLELSRLNLLDSLQSVRNSATRISLFGFPVTGIGFLLGEPLVTDIGWAVTGIALAVWLGAGVLSRFFLQRIPYEHVSAE